MRCCAWSKLESVSVCAWTSASSGASCLSTVTVAGWLLTKTRPFAVGQNLAAQNDFRAFGVDAVFLENVFGAGRGFEHAGDHGLVGAVANHVGRCLAAHQQSQRIDENGFARAGFACEQVEPRAEDGDGVIDDGVVLGAELDEHESRSPVLRSRLARM